MYNILVTSTMTKERDLLFDLLGIINITEIRDGRKVFLVRTRGVRYEIPFDLQLKMIETVLTEMVGKITWVVFKDCEKRYLEDQGRTCFFPLSLLDRDCKTKVWVILDEYESVETFQNATNNKHIKTKYKLTFLLPEEY